MIYTKSCQVPASMCDGATRLSVIAVFQAVEDSVTELMGELRGGYPGHRESVRGRGRLSDDPFGIGPGDGLPDPVGMTRSGFPRFR